MIPGMGGLNIPKELIKSQEGKIEKWKYLMDSMTKEELEDPEIITNVK
jgi:signal recognition particle subunit SRP54